MPLTLPALTRWTPPSDTRGEGFGTVPSVSAPSPLAGEGRGEGYASARTLSGLRGRAHPSPSRFAGPSLSHKGRGDWRQA